MEDLSECVSDERISVDENGLSEGSSPNVLNILLNVSKSSQTKWKTI